MPFYTLRGLRIDYKNVTKLLQFQNRYGNIRSQQNERAKKAPFLYFPQGNIIRSYSVFGGCWRASAENKKLLGGNFQ